MTAQAIPQQRVVEKLDEYMSRRDYAGAERHLLYWLEEAVASGDERGQLMVRNELVGHFRKTGNREQALLHGQEALRLVDEMGFDATISAGTTYTNVATACNAFGENERALELFGKALQRYEGAPNTDPRLLGGLYNNMALACVALGRFDEADGLYAKALMVMEGVEHGELEQAITHLNMADGVIARAMAAGGNVDAATERSADAAAEGSADAAAEGSADAAARAYELCEGEVDFHLETAEALLNTPSVPHDGYYAFVCEKCAPTFAHYGYFLVDRDLRDRAAAVYEGARR